MTNQRKPTANHVICALIAMALTACSNDSNDSNQGENARLQRAQSNAALESYLKAGLKQAVSTNGNIENVPAEILPGTDSPDVGAADGEDGQGVSLGFSTTNLIEQGVDEPDHVKFDGTNIYIAAATYQYCIELCEPILADIAVGEPTGLPQTTNTVRVMQVSDATHSATQIARIEIPAADKYDNETLNSLLLTGDDESRRLVSIMDASNYALHTENDMAWTSIWAWAQGATVIDTFDVTNPAQSTHQSRIDIDGYLVAARRIDDLLYVVTRFTPAVTTSGEISQQLSQIDELSLEQLLPKISIDGHASALVQASDCFIDSTASGYPTLMVVTAIDLRDNEVHSSCVTANLYNVYMTKTAVYLSQIAWSENASEQTHIYKFALQGNGTHYRGEGVVEGSLAGNQYFAMNEYDGVLRVVTHSWNADANAQNRLYTLAENDSGNLDTLATLPNEQHPATIGKPNETIQGVRFVGDHAYVVTFQQMDPLYVIDLSNPQNPFIAGEVEIPGFSSLLQPLENNLLLGVGTENNQLKVELYDVANPSSPVSLGKYLPSVNGTGYSSSAASWDHHALTLLQLPDDTVRVAMPFYGSQYINDSYTENRGALSLLVDTNQRTLSLAAETPVATEGWLSGTQRVVLHDSTLHYIEGSSIWSTAWGSSEPLTTVE